MLQTLTATFAVTLHSGIRRPPLRLTSPYSQRHAASIHSRLRLGLIRRYPLTDYRSCLSRQGAPPRLSPRRRRKRRRRRPCHAHLHTLAAPKLSVLRPALRRLSLHVLLARATPSASLSVWLRRRPRRRALLRPCGCRRTESISILWSIARRRPGILFTRPRRTFLFAARRLTSGRSCRYQASTSSGYQVAILGPQARRSIGTAACLRGELQSTSLIHLHHGRCRWSLESHHSSSTRRSSD